LQIQREIPILSFRGKSRKSVSEAICEKILGDKTLLHLIEEEWLNPESENVKQRIAILGKANIGKTQLLKLYYKKLKRDMTISFMFRLKILTLMKK